MKNLYGHKVEEKELNDAILSGDEIIIDAQNYDNCNEKILSSGYKMIREGYELTGLCDLYQFHYKKEN